MSPLLTLVRMTLLELWRQRMGTLPFLVLVLAVVAAFLPPSELTVNGQAMALRGQDLGGLEFQVLQFFGVFLGLSVGAGLVANEVERGTVLLIATKPIARWQFLAGKALGGFVFLAGWFAVWSLAFAVIVAARMAGLSFGPLFVGGLTGVVTGWLFAALAFCFSTRLPALGAMGAGLFVWILASAAPNIVRFEGVRGYELVGHAARWLAWLVPVDGLKEIPYALAFGPLPSPQQCTALATIPLWLALAVLAFHRRSLAQ